MYTKIIEGIEGKKKILLGMKVVSNSTAKTMGPSGENIGYDKGNDAPLVSNDGARASRNIKLKDKFENMGASIQRDLTARVALEAGDNTSTASVLGTAFSEEVVKMIDLGARKIHLVEGMTQAKNDIVAALKSIARPVELPYMIYDVALTSSENKDIALAISDTIKTIGKDGLLTFEESAVSGVRKEITQGMKIDSGYVSEHLITNAIKRESEILGVPVMVTTAKIYNEEDISPIAKCLAEKRVKGMVLVCEDIDGQALNFVNLNKVQGGFFIFPVKIPKYADMNNIALDIAVFTGATVIEPGILFSPELDVNSVIAKFGYAKKLVSNASSTNVIGGKADIGKLNDHALALKNALLEEENSFEKEKLEARLASISGGVSVIKIGARSDSELSYLKDKLEDTIANTKAAMEQGILPGGGTALINAGAIVPAKKYSKKHPDFQLGYACILSKLSVPFRCIAGNAGREDIPLIIKQILDSKGSAGYNANADTIVPDMFKEGIVDSLKSIVCAFEHAVDSTISFLRTDSWFAEYEDEE